MTMEKKEYIEPSMIVRVVNMNASILAGSFEFNDDNNTGTTTPIDDNADGPALGKGFTSADVWED